MQERLDDIEIRIDYLESEITDKNDFYQMENRIEKIETEVKEEEGLDFFFTSGGS